MKKALKILLPLTMIVLIIVSIGWYLFEYDRDFTRDTLVSQARYYSDRGNADLASWFYELAYAFTDQDEDIAIEVANQYKADGNYTKAEFTLTNAISDGGTAELYIALSKTYIEQDKLLDAVNMLNHITDPAIKAELESLRPSAPVASPAPDFYSEYIDVTLSCGGGTLYFTTDQAYPSTGDAPFSAPISLPVGETTIYALCVGDNGLVSALSELDYTIGGIVEEVKFTDPAMENAIRASIGVDADHTVLTNELWNVTEFTVPTEAASFQDLAYLSGLQNLTLQDHQLADLTILSELTALQAVNLSGCRFPAEALSVLAELPELKRLDLSQCALSTIAGLEGAENLTHLYLSGNTLRNLKALSGMKYLVELILDHNAVVDLSALSSLGNLEKLDLSFNSITTLVPLASCQKLSWLNLNNNSISALDTVDTLPNLKHLDLGSNSLTDVAILASCTALTELNLSKNQITEITMLSTLSALEDFDFSYNEVEELPKWSDEGSIRKINGSYNKLKSIDSLANQKNLSYVYMDYNKLKSVNAIADCYHLVMVNVYGNEIKDVSKLTEHDIIVNYDPT